VMEVGKSELEGQARENRIALTGLAPWRWNLQAPISPNSICKYSHFCKAGFKSEFLALQDKAALSSDFHLRPSLIISSTSTTTHQPHPPLTFSPSHSNHTILLKLYPSRQSREGPRIGVFRVTSLQASLGSVGLNSNRVHLLTSLLPIVSLRQETESQPLSSVCWWLVRGRVDSCWRTEDLVSVTRLELYSVVFGKLSLSNHNPLELHPFLLSFVPLIYLHRSPPDQVDRHLNFPLPSPPCRPSCTSNSSLRRNQHGSHSTDHSSKFGTSSVKSFTSHD
jgi:hypothetical protein